MRIIKAGEGGPILGHGPVDELRLMVFPVVIGGGPTVVPGEREKHELELTELERYSSGVVLQVYRPTS
ncbi:MAG: dihydrofolate reductase family protein [Acidimicrobiales bacterium]